MIPALSLYNNSKLGFQQRLAMELLSMRLKVGVGAAAWQWNEHEMTFERGPSSTWETDEKGKPLAPYTCPDCGKSYMWKQGLNTHKRLHCGKEPRFQCPYCPKRCYQRGNLDSHIRNVHANLLHSSEILCKEEVNSSNELKN